MVSHVVSTDRNIPQFAARALPLQVLCLVHNEGVPLGNIHTAVLHKIPGPFQQGCTAHQL